MNEVYYVSYEFVNYYRANFSKFVNFYRLKNEYKIEEIFSSQYMQTGKTFKFKPLVFEGVKNIEKENIKTVYNSLKNLSLSEASDERLWVAMYHRYYINDLFRYIEENKNHKNFNTKIESSIFFTRGKQRSKIVQNLARYWWIGHHLIDDKNPEPYHLLDFYTDTKDIIGKSTIFLSSNFNNNKEITLGIVQGIKNLVDKNIITNERRYYTKITKYFNLLGATQILDVMSRREAEKITVEYLTK